jgi:hypothetical protein
MMMEIIWLMMINNNTGGGFNQPPLKNHGVKVSWDDDIPNMMGKIIQSCSKPPTMDWFSGGMFGRDDCLHMFFFLTYHGTI